MRELDEQGCVFFTNYESRKGRHLAANPRAALLFSWVPVNRQIELVGSVARIDRAETDTYFAARPRGSQIAAWASDQSTVLPDRAALEERFRGGRGALRRRAGALPAALGRLPAGARHHRAVAGPAQPPPRPPPLHAGTPPPPTGWRLERLSP